MPHKDPEARKAYNREYRKANRERLNKLNREYRKANVERLSEQRKEYRKANVERLSAQQKEYRKANAERISAQRKEYYEANVERERAYGRAYGKRYYKANSKSRKAYRNSYYKANSEKVKNLTKRWQKANPEKKHANCASRRARKKECSVPLTQTEKTKLRSMSRKMQRLNKKKGGVEYHIDHILPLDYGGVHHPCNLQILKSSENSSKHNKITPEGLDLVPVCYRLYLERVGLEKAKWFRDQVAEAIGLDEANRLIGVALEDLME
jgi:hypothetical protein